MELFRYPGVTSMQELTPNPLKPVRGGDEPVLGGAVGQGVMLRALPALGMT